MLTIIIGYTSSGKSRYADELVSNHNYIPLISATTRPIRTNEKDGVDYYFKSDDEFQAMIDNNELIEYREYNTIQGKWYYGVPKQELDNRQYVVVTDLNGAKDLIQYYGDINCKVVYVEADYKIRLKRAEIRDRHFDITEFDRRNKFDMMDFPLDEVSDITDIYINNNCEQYSADYYGNICDIIGRDYYYVYQVKQKDFMIVSTYIVGTYKSLYLAEKVYDELEKDKDEDVDNSIEKIIVYCS